ncbi:uncharacterized protein LOC144701165 [Wolffia australiana]
MTEIRGSKGKASQSSSQTVKKRPDGSGSNAAKSSSLRPHTTTTSVTKTSTKTTSRTKTKAEKKVYNLAGQKYDRPEEREPLRIFYESLSKQIPSSEMAEFWMMEHGLLSPERAKKAYEKKQRRQQQLRTGVPIRSPEPERIQPSKKPLSLPKNHDIKTRKRVNYSNDDEEFPKKLKKTRN